MDWFLYDNGLRHERVKDTSPFSMIFFGIGIHCSNYDLEWVSFFTLTYLCVLLMDISKTNLRNKEM